MQIIFSLNDTADQFGISLEHPKEVAKLAAYREAVESLKHEPLPALDLRADNLRTWDSQIDTATHAHARRATIDRHISPSMVTAARAAEDAAYWQHADHYLGQIAPVVALAALPEQMPSVLTFANALATRHGSKLAPIAALTNVPDQIDKQIINGDADHRDSATPDQVSCRRIHDAVHHGHLATAVAEIATGNFPGFEFSPAETMAEFQRRIEQLENGSTITRTVAISPMPKATNQPW